MRSFSKLGAPLMALAASVSMFNIAGCPQMPDPEPIPQPLPQPQPQPRPLPQAKPSSPRLFVGGLGSNSMQTFTNPGLLNGNLPPSANLAGAQTLLAQPSDMAVTDDGLMIVSNFAGNSLTFYADAEALNGNIEPAKNISGPATGITAPNAIAWDDATDGLFVADNNAAARIKLFAKVSDPGSVGNVAPLHAINSAEVNAALGLSLANTGALYVANGPAAIAQRGIIVFEKALTLNGTVSASRVIRSPIFNTAVPMDVQVTADDTMYVVTLDNRVHTFKQASSLNGTVMPDATLTVTGASFRAIAVDRFGTGYVTLQAAVPGVLVFDQIATRNGTFAPDRTIAGNQTQITLPWGIYFWE